MARITLFLLTLFLPGHEALAGWIIVERTGHAGSDSLSVSTLFIQDNMIKSVNQDHTLIFDLDRRRLTYINPDRGGYWTGQPAEYISFVKEHILEYLKMEIDIADEYSKPYLQAMYEDLKFDLEHDGEAVSFIGELPVSIIMTDETDRILGYRVNMFNVYIDGKKVEEIWLTRDIILSDEYDYETFRSFIDEMSWGGMFQDYRSSESYIHLMKTGLPLRTIEEGEEGSVIKTEVVSIEQKSIPGSDFSPPSRYRSMSLSELGLELPL